jgi:membrane protein
MGSTVAERPIRADRVRRRARVAWGRLAANTSTLLIEAFRSFRRHRAVEVGAALAYYTIFSLAPVLVVAIAVAGLVFGHEAARGEIFAQFRGLIGAEGARTLELAVESASRPQTGVIATVIGVVLMLAGATGVFAQLQSTLDRIWEVTPVRSGFRALLRQQLVSFAMVLGTGFLLLVSLVASAALSAFGRWFGALWAELPLLLQLTNLVVSLVAIAALFACMFKMLPSARVAWRDVWVGAAITSVLFMLGKLLIGLYVTMAHVGAAYGVAGSVLVILVWIYYSSQIFFFGAECTRVYANRGGSCIRGLGTAPGADPRCADPPPVSAAPG